MKAVITGFQSTPKAFLSLEFDRGMSRSTVARGLLVHHVAHLPGCRKADARTAQPMSLSEANLNTVTYRS